MTNDQKIDIVILSNGPGEIVTWVRPVVKTLRQELDNSNNKIRISVILCPCPHSTGKETAIAQNYPEVDRVLAPDDFFAFLLLGKTKDNWNWYQQGIVIFLGGDQFYTVIISKRLGYSSVVYAEWDARWYRWIDRFAVMNEMVTNKLPMAYRHKCTVVGDLIADVSLEVQNDNNISDKNTDNITIGLLVGSKPAKLLQGVPLCLAVAEIIHQQQPQVEFIIPVAPTLNLETLASYANWQYNPLVSQFGGVQGSLIATQEENSQIITTNGVKIQLITQFPAYAILNQCQLCLTTVGANTAELATLGIPMIVLLPTQQLDAMRAWDGLPGILANLPGVGSLFAKLINWLIIKQKRWFAWPNIWANSSIVPELVGKLQPEQIANLVLDYLANPERLQAMTEQLIAVRGKAGAARQIVTIVGQELYL